MKTFKNNTDHFLFGIFSSNPGTPVSGVHFYLETEPDKKLIAFQQTGESGSVTFAHTDKGVYKIYLEIPKQKESSEKKDASVPAHFTVGYHSKKMLLFYQNPTGNYLLKFSEVEKLAENNITPMHETESAENNTRIALGKVEVTGKYGKISMKLSALSESSFQKQIKKYEHDAGMALISQ